MMRKVEGGILLGGRLNSCLRLLTDVGRYPLGVTKCLRDPCPQVEFDLLNPKVEFAQRGRKVKATLDQQILDPLLNGPLALAEERLKVINREGIAKEEIKRGS